MAIISLQEITISFGSENLLDAISFQIEKGEKIALLGRNGAGKSTLMKIIHRQIETDHGTLVFDRYFKSALLQQEVPISLNGSIGSILSSDLHKADLSDEEITNRTDHLLSLLSLERETLFEKLSAGMKRRVLLGRALAIQPDLLLLDEPTNHLDIESIIWLENFLNKYTGTVLMVTHDRAFMQKISNRIIEIDRGNLFDWRCNYSTFIERKNNWLENEEQQNKLFDKKLSDEEAWIRKGIRARRTRNEGRVRALEKMRIEHQGRRLTQGKAKLEAHNANLSGKMVLEAENLTFSFSKSPLFADFSIRIIREDKIGIIGPNGCGKSTLIKVLLGEIAAQKGNIRLGANLEIIYFDQLRGQIDDNLTILENVSGGAETISFNGRDRHIISYLNDFLFLPERVHEKCSNLSGGEKNRLLLAKLFTKPANVLVLDEPTNDLDIETVELLEELIIDFKGTVLVISHDRSFLNNCVTDIISFNENRQLLTYAGGYDDYLIQSSGINANKNLASKDKNQKIKTKKIKMSYKEERELEKLPLQLEKCESQIQSLHAELSNPEIYKKNHNDLIVLKEKLDKEEENLENLFARWEELEEKNESVNKSDDN